MYHRHTIIIFNEDGSCISSQTTGGINHKFESEFFRPLQEDIIIDNESIHTRSSFSFTKFSRDWSEAIVCTVEREGERGREGERERERERGREREREGERGREREREGERGREREREGERG